MPIVDLEFVHDGDAAEPLPRARLDALADALGAVFGSAPGGTWLRVRTLPAARYAESGGPCAERPVFVTVLAARVPERAALAGQMERVAAAVADASGRPPGNVHVLFEPAALGRIGFGGVLRE